MALQPETLLAIARLVSAAPGLREAAGAIRQGFPDLRATVVDADELRDEKPALTLGNRLLYLVSTDGHCWQVTRDASAASGVMLAEV